MKKEKAAETWVPFKVSAQNRHIVTSAHIDSRSHMTRPESEVGKYILPTVTVGGDA